MAAAPSQHPPEHLSHPKYRADIDGLRAIAVLSVVGFHAFPGLVKGGFIGVDIFFVISGFLISTIIFENLDKDRFSFIEFYGRRVRRIFPALLTTLLACLVFGWFYLLADEFAQLGKHVAGGAGFISNLLLWHESGYFDNASENKPLLHLWSLGIEEQYYIVWPLLLWFGWRRRFNFLAISIVICLISFAANVATIHGDQVGAFYSPVSRFWELLIGSLLAYVSLYHPETSQNIGRPFATGWSVGGFVLLATGLVLLDRSSAFPGWWALLPTLGAAAIIFAGARAWPNRVILSNRLMVWFGAISFPLYLWHWPLLALARVVDGGEPSRAARALLMAIAVALAWLTYRWIERPLRFGDFGRIKSAGLVAAMVVVGVLGYAVHWNDGFEGYGFRSQERSDFDTYFANVPEGRWTAFFEKNFRHECNFFPKIRGDFKFPDEIDKSCYLVKEPRRNTVFIWGDSNAQMLNYGLKMNLPPDWQILQIASSDCPAAIVPDKASARYCQNSNAFALKAITEARPDVVVIAQKKEHDATRMHDIAAHLRTIGVGRVVFTGPAPHWEGDLPKIIVRRLWKDTPERTMVGVDRTYLLNDAALKKQFPPSDEIVFVDIIGLFCNADGCLTRIGADRKEGITTWDYGHLTPVASEFLARNVLADVVRSGGRFR